MLKVDANGDPEWATGGGGGTQADWDETDPLEPSYIENKPTPKTLVAGQGIAISESSASLTVTNTVARDAVNLVAGSGVTLTQSGSDLTISSAGTTYTAGTGIDITNDEISLEAPVDIVAGPGIAIDNPDGNTVRVSLASTPYNETVLFSTNTFAPGDAQQTYNLSESPLNFERIAVYVCRPVTPAPWMGYIEFYPAFLSNAGRTEIGAMGSFNASGTIYLTTYTAINVLTTQWKDGASRQATIGGAWDSAYFSHIYRIVGINRIAGGN